MAPLLKMRMDADNKEWRTHLEHTQELQQNIKGNWRADGKDKKEEGEVPRAKEQLSKLSNTIAEAIDAITTRENTINTQYKKEVTEYHEVQERLQEIDRTYDERNREVSTQNSLLQQISEQLENIKSQSDERGESMTGMIVFDGCACACVPCV